MDTIVMSWKFKVFYGFSVGENNVVQLDFFLPLLSCCVTCLRDGENFFVDLLTGNFKKSTAIKNTIFSHIKNPNPLD